MNMSASFTYPFTASSISRAVSTRIVWAAAGGWIAVGPDTSVTRAPASIAARATAYPIFPELRFVRPRTGSIGSKVGPAGTRTWVPDENLGRHHAHHFRA